MTKKEKIVRSAIVRYEHLRDRNKICRATSIYLNDKKGINVAADEAAHDYLCAALDDYADA